MAHRVQHRRLKADEAQGGVPPLVLPPPLSQLPWDLLSCAHGVLPSPWDRTRSGGGVGHDDFAPAQEMQPDTSPHRAPIDGIEQRIETASLLLCYSRMLVFQAYPAFPRFYCKDEQ